MHAHARRAHIRECQKASQTCTRQLVFQSCRCSVQLQPCHACQGTESFHSPAPPFFFFFRGGAIKAYGEHNSGAGGGGRGRTVERGRRGKERCIWQEKKWSGRKCRGEKKRIREGRVSISPLLNSVTAKTGEVWGGRRTERRRLDMQSEGGFWGEKNHCGLWAWPFFSWPLFLFPLISHFKERKRERGSEIDIGREREGVKGWWAGKLRPTHIAFQAWGCVSQACLHVVCCMCPSLSTPLLRHH